MDASTADPRTDHGRAVAWLRRNIATSEVLSELRAARAAAEPAPAAAPLPQPAAETPAADTVPADTAPARPRSRFA